MDRYLFKSKRKVNYLPTLISVVCVLIGSTFMLESWERSNPEHIQEQALERLDSRRENLVSLESGAF